MNRRRDDVPVVLEVFWRRRLPERYRHPNMDSALGAAAILQKNGVGCIVSVDDGSVRCYGDDE